MFLKVKKVCVTHRRTPQECHELFEWPHRQTYDGVTVKFVYIEMGCERTLGYNKEIFKVKLVVLGHKIKPVITNKNERSRAARDNRL